MCLYIYAPNSKIRVLYTSELIRLESNGSMSVVADCLIQKVYDDQEEQEEQEEQEKQRPTKLRIIYPNKKLIDGKTFGKSFDPNIIDVLDLTETFDPQKDPTGINRAYDQLHGTSVERHPLENKTLSWASSRILHHDEENRKFEGIFGNKGKLSFRPLDERELETLFAQTAFKVLTYEFSPEQPLDENARWIRLKFKGRDADNLNGMNLKWLKKIVDGLHYEYKIFGPHDLLREFKDQLRLLGNTIKTSTTAHWHDILDDICEFFKKDGLITSQHHKKSSTDYDYIFLHIDPGNMEQITYNREGSVKSVGGSPDFVTDPPVTQKPGIGSPQAARQATRRIYRWTALPNGEGKSSFTIRYQANPFNPLWRLVPWVLSLIAILIGIISIALRFFNC